MSLLLRSLSSLVGMKSLYYYTCLLLLATAPLPAQKAPSTTTVERYRAVVDHLEEGLLYLQNTQRKETVAGTHYRGEWPSAMKMTRGYLYLGGKQTVDDSNCFAVASIHNAIAEIYLQYPDYTHLLPTLDMAFDKIMTYRNGDRFNFWNLLPPNIPLRPGAVMGEQPLVRRPTNYPLRSRYINNAANVVEDADDTSLSYAAIALRKQYRGVVTDSFSLTATSVAPIFEAYRDKDRDNLHWYNYFLGGDRNTGAYMTWLGEEGVIKRWNLLKSFVHSASFFIPSSYCYPDPYVPYIPYGTNDLDGVVNANVLSALAMYDELDADGVAHSVAYIERKSRKKKYGQVGIYYPNKYHFPYVVSKAYRRGVHTLRPSMDNITRRLLSLQEEDGSWRAKRRLNHGDVLQSTSNALNALLNGGDLTDTLVVEAVEAGIDYMLGRASRDERGLHWEGGVFFSGGTVIRNTLVWMSDAYTTATMLTALSTYRKYLEETYGLSPSD